LGRHRAAISSKIIVKDGLGHQRGRQMLLAVDISRQVALPEEGRCSIYIVARVIPLRPLMQASR
jgi:hypothetical protein